MLDLPPPLAPLAAWDQFVCWYAWPSAARPGKMDKLPIHHATGALCDAQDPGNWTNAQNALAMARRWDKGYGSGAGFVITAQDPFFCLDIDKCAVDGGWSPLALELCARLAGCAVEVSQSGEGLHIWGQCAPVPHKSRNIAAGIELYTEKRFIAVTGTGAMGDASFCPAGLYDVVATWFAPDAADLGAVEGWTTEPVADWAGPDDDGELMRRALLASDRSPAAAFGGAAGKASLRDLWEGRIDPDRRSESDQALAFHLAFWTGRNCERIERLMRASGLMRDKWDSPSHASYLTNTILKAAGGATAVYRETPAQPLPASDGHDKGAPLPLTRSGSEFMYATTQAEFFAKCFYVLGRKEVFCLDSNMMLDRGNFDIVYGGYLFVLDPNGEKKTDSAFEAFTRSRVNSPAVVNDVCFRPELEPGVIVTEGLRRYVNSYVPHECISVAGDVSPFLSLLAKLLPDPQDRNILTHYLASMAQNPGVKFQWWPVIQGAQGNGKTTLLTIMTYIAGEHYTHLPNAHSIARDGLKFNSWIDRKTFIGIEEIQLSSKRDFLEEFKTVITNRRMAMEGKGTNAGTGDNRANGMLLTNHRDGVPIKKKDRRYAIFFCAQQHADDLLRDGMGGDYFPRLHDWLEGKGAFQGHMPGKAYIAHYLKTFPLTAELDPAQLCHRAPETSSTADAIIEGQGRLEQEISELIEEGAPGFAGGWVSGYYLGLLLDKLRINVPPRRRKDMMLDMGYRPHPALLKGRVDNPVMPDTKKPILYIRIGHVSENLTARSAVAEAYSKAQEAVFDAAVQEAAVLAFGKPGQ